MTDRLWAPWRVKYVTALDRKPKGCIFCRMKGQKKDKENYIFKRTKHSFAVLNLYPYNNGHSLVVPFRHVGSLENLTKEEKQDLFDLLESVKLTTDKVMRPKGFNIGMNLGKVAGAGFPGHLHIHVVPRWAGDVNFMPVVTGTKVISQSLCTLYGKLKKCVHAKR